MFHISGTVAKHGRRLSMIMKGEAQNEKDSLEIAMKELQEIQRIQRAVVQVSLSVITTRCR
jgi:hypothetical protein